MMRPRSRQMSRVASAPRKIRLCSMTSTVTPAATMRLMRAGEIGLLELVEAGGRLVEQQQARIGGERARDLDAAARAVGKLAAQRTAATSRNAEQTRERSGARACLRQARVGAEREQRRAQRRPLAAERADGDIVETLRSSTRSMCWKVRAMPSARDRVRRQVGDRPAGEGDLAGVGDVEPGDHVDQRGLARAVRSDQADDLALAHVEIDPVERLHAAELLGDAAHAQQRARRPASGCRAGGSSAPPRIGRVQPPHPRRRARRRGRSAPTAARSSRRCRRARAIRIASVALV